MFPFITQTVNVIPVMCCWYREGGGRTKARLDWTLVGCLVWSLFPEHHLGEMMQRGKLVPALGPTSPIAGGI